MAKAARHTWPGNDIPIFRGNVANLKKLTDVVTELTRTCETPYFGEAAIRRHILDSLAEPRRMVEKGYDYLQVCRLNVLMCIIDLYLFLYC